MKPATTTANKCFIQLKACLFRYRSVRLTERERENSIEIHKNEKNFLFINSCSAIGIVHIKHFTQTHYSNGCVHCTVKYMLQLNLNFVFVELNDEEVSNSVFSITLYNSILLNSIQ